MVRDEITNLIVLTAEGKCWAILEPMAILPYAPGLSNSFQVAGGIVFMIPVED